MGRPDDVEPHVHHHHADDHCHLSAKYAEYVEIRLDDLRSKCDQLTECINELLSQLSSISVLRGDDLSIRKICNLINIKGNSTKAMLHGKCSLSERRDIMEYVDNQLKDKLEKRNSWENVAACLEGNYGDNERTTNVGDICGLAEKYEEICKNYDIHKQVEKYVNEQIEHLQCTCKALARDSAHTHEHMSTSTMVGIGVGGVLLLCLIVLGLVFFFWRRKLKRKKKSRQNIIYLPAAGQDNCPVYQEIFDQRSPPLSPPSLPSRYGSRPLPGHPQEEAEYLEPVQAQAASNSYRAKAPPPLHRTVNNPGYEVEAPPSYTETDQLYEDAILMEADGNAYFEPIVTPKTGKPDSYDTLEAAEKPQEDDSSLPDTYQPLEDIDTNKPLGPDPAERTKKEDRQTESEYFELEKQEV